MTLSDTAATPAAPPVPALSRLWNRQLPHYPSIAVRRRYLALTVLSTISLYYMAYAQGSVATQIVAQYHLTFLELVLLGVFGNAVGALASLAAGLADRFGRANLIVGGMLVSSVLVAFAIPHAGSKGAFFTLTILLGLVEGAVLVATPALVRDFSPQVGRGQAMGFWTLGPVLGSLVVTLVSSHTLSSHPDWRWQYYAAGTTGLVVTALALVGLRELSPGLRDQLMVSERERVLVEARAAGIDPEKLLKGHWRQVLKLDVIGPALAISVFLLLYYALVGFLVVYFATVFGWSEAKANGLGNWYWATNALTLVLTGFLTDKLRVRKPFMVVGVAISVVGNVMFALASTDPTTSYGYFALCFVLSSFGGGMAYVAWMAAFTETVERHNPAATATGLAVWGWLLRSVVTVSLLVLTLVVPATSQIVDHGPRLQQIAAKYPSQIALMQELDPTVLSNLGDHPGDLGVQAAAVADLANLDQAQVFQALLFNSEHQTEIQTAQAIEPATLAALSATPPPSSAIDAAVRQIATKLGLSPAKAGERLIALSVAPKATLLYLQQHATALTAAGARLTSLSAIPAADATYLKDHAADVQQAQKVQAKQWQHWWWVCIGGQIAFLPFVFLLVGRWSPRGARRDAQQYEALVDNELRALREGELPEPRQADDSLALTD